VLAGKYSSQGAVDDVFPLGEARSEVDSKLRDGVDGHVDLLERRRGGISFDARPLVMMMVMVCVDGEAYRLQRPASTNE
jgi:hypothetical protein